MNNYRGISLQNIFSKIYASIINRRLQFFAQIYNKISEGQAGFKQGYSTADNLFILRALVERHLSKKRGKLYVGFIDFHKAFDLVKRPLLWKVIRKLGVKGGINETLQNMYKSVKACIRCNNTLTDNINCPIGLKQGCLVSPILFSLFVDKFAKLLQTSGYRGIQLLPDWTEIFLLTYADDIAYISDTIIGLQRQLNLLANFCDRFKLRVNKLKTKVLVFKNGGILSHMEKWYYKGSKHDVVNRFTYVGLLFTTQLSLDKMVNELCIKGKRVLTSILSSLHNYGLMTKEMYFKLFDVKICSQLLYSAEIWGLRRFECLERIQNYACKRYMNISQKACNAAVLGDCNRFPLHIETVKPAVKYWLRILKMGPERYVKKCYAMLVNDDKHGRKNWVSELRGILFENGFGYVWNNQGVLNEKSFLTIFERRLKDVYIQNWYETLSNSSKLESCRQYKLSYTPARFLDVLKIRKFRYYFSSFRCSSHDLEIERGRYTNIDRSNRLCKLCGESVEDEYHFLLVCHIYEQIRNECLPYKYTHHPNRNKFNILMSSNSANVIKSVADYLYRSFELRKQILSNI